MGWVEVGVVKLGLKWVEVGGCEIDVGVGVGEGVDVWVVKLMLGLGRG